MTAAPAPAPQRPVGPGGAWLSFAVACWAGLTFLSSFAVVVGVAAVPLFVDVVDRSVARRVPSAEVPPEFGRVLDLGLDAAELVRPWAQVTGWSGVAIGLLLFGAAVAFGRGSEGGRRAARALLVLVALHGIAATAWLVVLGTKELAGWAERWQETIADLQEATRSGGPRVVFPQLSVEVQAAVQVLSSLTGLVVTGVLIWLAGRPFARAWCAARSGRSPIAGTASPS